MKKIQRRRDGDNPYLECNPKELKQKLKQRKLIFNGSKDKCISRLLVDDLSHQIYRIFGDNLQIGYTFGSRLYGNAKKDSDFDYLVLMKPTAFDQTFDEEMLKKENAEIRSMYWFIGVGWFPDLPEIRKDFKDQRFLFIDESYYQVWVISEISFKLMVSHCIPLAVECLSLEMIFSQEKKPHNSYDPSQDMKGTPFVFHHRELVKPGCKLTTELPKYPLSQIYQTFGLTAKTMWELVRRQLANFAADPTYSDEDSTVALSPMRWHAIEKHMYNSFRILTFGIQVTKFGAIQNFKASNVVRTEIVNPIPKEVNPRDHFLLIEKQTRFRHPLLNLYRDLSAVCHPNFDQELDLSFLQEHKVKILEYNSISEQAFQNLNTAEITKNWLLMVDNAPTLYSLSLVCKQFYTMLHDKEFVKTLCLAHFGRTSCLKYFTPGVQSHYWNRKSVDNSFSDDTAMLPFHLDWFSCFKVKSWANQFGNVKSECVLCKVKQIEDSHRFSRLCSIKSSYERSWEWPQKAYRGRILLFECQIQIGWDSYDELFETHIWGKIANSHFGSLWSSLPNFNGKSPPCGLCPSTHTKNATEFVTPGRGGVVALCSNGHFFGTREDRSNNSWYQ